MTGLTMHLVTMTSPVGNRHIRREQLLISTQIALVAFLAYLVGFYFTGLFPDYLPKIGGLWSAISLTFKRANTREA